MPFSKDNRPERPGVYFNFEAIQEAAIQPAVGSVVALGFVHDWGPLEQATAVNSFAEWKAVYGKTASTEGYRAARMAFQGEGAFGRSGAGQVVAFRMGGSGAAKATKNLTNAAATPVTGVTLSARYEGTKGNDLKVTVQDKAGDSTKTELILYDTTLEVERYTFDDTDIADLVDQINAISQWVTATLAVDGVALATTTSASFTGGDSGTTLVAQDYTDAMSAISVERFGILAFANLTDTSILASLLAWATEINETGTKRFMVVVGGEAGEDASDAMDRSADLNSELFINVGVGSTLALDVIDDTTGEPVEFSTAELAPRVAGILANRGEAMSLTFARMSNTKIIDGAADTEIATLFKNGVTVLSRDSNLEAPVRIEKGVTTYTTKTDENKPYLIYRVPKNIMTMGGFQFELQEWANVNLIGRLPVNNKTRDFVLGEVKKRLKAREEAGVIQPGWTAEVDPDPAPSDSDEFVAVLIGMLFGRSTEQTFFTVRVG